jgi:hypothetical protein
VLPRREVDEPDAAPHAPAEVGEVLIAHVEKGRAPAGEFLLDEGHGRRDRLEPQRQRLGEMPEGAGDAAGGGERLLALHGEQRVGERLIATPDAVQDLDGQRIDVERASEVRPDVRELLPGERVLDLLEERRRLGRWQGGQIDALPLSDPGDGAPRIEVAALGEEFG